MMQNYSKGQCEWIKLLDFLTIYRFVSVQFEEY